MIKAGSQFGMQLLWVLALSCLFSWLLMEAYGRYAVITGRTSINSFKTSFRYGKLVAILVIVEKIMGKHRAGWALNTGLVAALVFSILISYNGLVVLGGYF